MSIATDSKETATLFLKEHIRTLDGVDQSTLYPVYRAKRFASLEKLIEHQRKYFTENGKKMLSKEIDLTFDWVEDFEYYAMLTGAFPKDL